MEKHVKAISPQEILDNLDTIIPHYVFEAVNKLLKEKFRGISVSIKQDDILNEIIANSSENLNRDTIIKNKWLDFEKVYAKQGWVVSYESPDRDESFAAYFSFKVKK